MSKTLVLFDFDGTITRKDSFIQFILFVKGRGRAIIGFILLSPVVFLMMVKIISRERAKIFFLRYFFSGNTYQFLTEKGIAFSNRINQWCRTEAIEKLTWHIANGHAVTVVTASSAIWVGEWCKQHRVGIIATTLEVIDGKITGNIEGQNCSGLEKVRRISKQFELGDFDEIYAYGNSMYDLPMLQLATKPRYNTFD